MSIGVNRVNLAGHVGQDGELSYTQGGQAVLKLRLAVNERRKGSDGEWADVAQWFTVLVWAKRGEALHKIICKGMALVVEGRIQQREYEARDGSVRHVFEVVASDVHIVGGGRRRDDEDGEQRAPVPDGFTRDESDIPF